MYLSIYTPFGRLPGQFRSMRAALARVRQPDLSGQPFAILERARRDAYPHGATSGRDGVALRSVLLMYPPDTAESAKIRPDEFILASGCKLA